MLILYRHDVHYKVWQEHTYIQHNFHFIKFFPETFEEMFRFAVSTAAGAILAQGRNTSVYTIVVVRIMVLSKYIYDIRRTQ